MQFVSRNFQLKNEWMNTLKLKAKWTYSMLVGWSCQRHDQEFQRQRGHLVTVCEDLHEHWFHQCKRGIAHPCNHREPKRPNSKYNSHNLNFTQYLNHLLHTFWICCANSRVGAKTSAWHSLASMSICCNNEMAKVAVLPVPDWAWAITSWPIIQGKMARCWMADGRSKP